MKHENEACIHFLGCFQATFRPRLGCPFKIAFPETDQDKTLGVLPSPADMNPTDNVCRQAHPIYPILFSPILWKDTVMRALGNYFIVVWEILFRPLIKFVVDGC